MHRKAFALPLVIAFIVVFAILVLAIINRQSGQRLLAQRDLDAYSDHHVSKGMQEALQAWISANSAQGISNAIDATDGHAFDIEPEGGRGVRVSFEEAQGTLLADFAGLSGADVELAALALTALEREQGREKASTMIRKEGPLAVSVLKADREVLLAVLQATLDESAAQDVLKRLEEARSDPEFSQQRLVEIINTAQASSEQRLHAMTLLTAEPTIWKVTAESPTSSGPPIRYEGLAMVPTASQRRTASGITRMSAILSWRKAQ
jgi:hypothetical protein